VALMDLGRHDEAIASYRRALLIDSNFADALSNLAEVLKELGLVEEAAQAFRDALERDPRHAAAHSNLVYTLSFHPNADAAAILAEARRWNERHGAAPQVETTFTHDRSPERRLRIGYVSPDFREHCQAQFTIPVFQNHDHRDFEIFCYASV